MTFKNIKNVFGAGLVTVLSLGAVGGGLMLTSCSDMLEAESTRQNIEPEILSKTDSLFYGYGILQAMQELADQYVFQGEMRGDLLKTTLYTDNNLRQLYDFSATTTNKYDSAYVYYKVINNCNYYIAHRDTMLFRGATNVVMNEYAAVKAIRAWAYLQLGRNYERVPFFTEPLTKISQIDNNSFPELDLNGLVSRLAPDLEQYTGYKVPTYGFTGTDIHEIGTPNWDNSGAKVLSPRHCYVPVDVVLGDMYLETGDYHNAARHFVTYLTQASDDGVSTTYLAPMASKNAIQRFGMQDDDLPPMNQISALVSSTPVWAGIFGINDRQSLADVITYIPMAVNNRYGKTTNLPLTFGFNYYATSEELSTSGNSDPYIDEIQLLPSAVLSQLSDSTEYYYYSIGGQNNFDSIRVATAGDMRLRSVMHNRVEGDSVMQYIDKYKRANVFLYRRSTVLLHLAEAFNRLDMPDAAFAILKDGICQNLIERRQSGEYYVTYLSDNTRRQLQTTYPLLSEENIQYFPNIGSCGIHSHGAGKAAGDCAGISSSGGSTYNTGKSPYQLDRMVGMKMSEIASVFGVSVGTTRQDTINAVEDLLCDEYALEFAFEGNRFFDLCRLARHKNDAGLYGSNFGSLWLARKLAFKNPAKDLTDSRNWYLPFK